MKKRILHIVLLLVFGVFVSGALMAQKLTNEQVARPTDQSAPKTEALGRAIGDDCNNPFLIEVDAVPFTYTDTQENGTCGHGNNYDNDEILGGYDDGEDVVYKIQVPQLSQAIITLNGTASVQGGYWHAVALYEGCPDVGELITYAKSDGYKETITLSQALEPNKEYFVLVDYWALNNDLCLTSYDITIEFSSEIIYFYDLYIAGIQVSSENASNLSVIDGVTGTVTYDDDSKTLTLNNANINLTDYEPGIINENIENLIIKLVGDNAINTNVNSIIIRKNTEISSSGLLTTTSTNYAGIYINKSTLLNIKDCTIEAVGLSWGFSGQDGTQNEDIEINNAIVRATGTTSGSIKDIQTLTLNGCVITAPEGAAFDESLHAVALNGEVVKEQVVIEPADGIEDVENMLGISIYPNPANDFVQINIEDAITHELSLQVYDMLGKLIESQTITEQTTQLNIKNLEKGVYILKIGNSTKRLIKN